MTGWLFRRVGVDLHIRDRYVIVGRVPVIVLCLLALGAMWLVLFLLKTVVSQGLGL